MREELSWFTDRAQDGSPGQFLSLVTQVVTVRTTVLRGRTSEAQVPASSRARSASVCSLSHLGDVRVGPNDLKGLF